MKTLFLALAFTTLFTPALLAQPTAAEDRDRALKYLEKTRSDLLSAIKDLSEAQWSFKPAPDRWSAAEIVEHITASETRLLNMIREQVMTAPARTNKVDLQEIDNMLLQRVPDRSNRVSAPEELRPTKRFGSPAATLKAFEENRAATIEFLKNTSGLRDHAVDSTFGHQLDAYQWILFIGAHCERHTKQLNEVKADPGFPKN
ncbi:MAG TPA: DinB family protein [Verrucomicrobia bacterium]|nr:DinB family protein [Verrucomicrobiota bacterium]HOB33792.1 DinB family protein [Verrucomicrobiota bacterium]HOP96156.1 DinB family protein [Verrucomicrobiota bacterium]HPU56484.1 DinB family protein [Verrucomicrobiota bacterium]